MESVGGKAVHSVQEAMRLGEAHDLYYYTKSNTSKQSIPTIVDTRFYQELNNLRAGSSTFIVSVDQGISDVIFACKLPEQGTGSVDYTNLALPRGWVYSLINRASVRYSSSSQYFWTGGQMMIQNLREMTSPSTRDQLFELGGACMTQVSDFAGDNMYAYAYLNLPHCSPNGGLAKPLPYPSELVGQPMVITLELNNLPSIFSTATSSAIVNAPEQLESAYFQVKQVHAKDAGELMSLPGGRGSAYSFPLKAFYQNEITVALPGSMATQSILLTGFRNGEVRSIIMWITKDSDTNPTSSGAYVKNFTNYVLPHDVELYYNGTLYYRARDASAPMWSLISTETPSQLPNTLLSLSGAGPVYDLQVAQTTANWIEVPFSQVFEQLSGAHQYVSGKLIQNAVVNVQLKTLTSEDCTLHAVYAYNATLMISDKGAEYFFA